VHDHAGEPQTPWSIVNKTGSQLLCCIKSMMLKNVGKTDKVIRIIVGVVIAALGIYYGSWWGLIAIIPLATAFAGSCLLYRVFGTSTRAQAKRS